MGENKQFIRQLVFIGSGERNVSPSDFDVFNSLIYSYNTIISATSDEEILNAFKGAVMCEKYFGSCGSTTPASRIYDEIQRRNLDSNYTLADWAFQYSDNEYIPFGFVRHGEKTAYEYLQRREEFHLRVMQERLEAEARKIERQKRAKEIAAHKKLSDTKAREMHKEIMLMEPHKQVQTIIEDTTRNPLFYMPVINGLLQKSDVPKQCWQLLLDKFTLLNSTPFNKRLIKDISSRLNNE